MLIGEVGKELAEDFKGKVIDVDCEANTLVGDTCFDTFLGLIQRT